MKNNPICTSVEQSKKLLDIGTDAETADLIYILRGNNEPRLTLFTGAPPVGMFNSVPAWSLSALINLLPDFIEENRVDFCLLMTKDRVVYWNPDKSNLFETDQFSLVDAVVETLCWIASRN